MKKKIGLGLVVAMLATGAAVFAGSNTVAKNNGKNAVNTACTCSKNAKCNNACSGHGGCTCAK